MGSVTLRHKSESKSGLEGERISKMLRQSKRKGTLKPGDTSDDIHVCILCLRAIMNNKFGFNKVMGHEQAINCIALSLVSSIQRLIGKNIDAEIRSLIEKSTFLPNHYETYWKCPTDKQMKLPKW